MSHSKRLKLGLRHSTKGNGFTARRRAHKAVEQDIAGWVGWLGKNAGTGELSTRAASYAKGKAYKSSLERYS
ncbi:hypothetical protein FDH66_gp12 [Arthrobacter phage Amigo]|uniref:Uncharacterized protein n=5 Tax=Amigovirus amigo TaxID=1982100 RepID=A0A5J6TY82_9CAUD|nr:hypothetical protein FDH66_gp04 [Arthrobacter phage Amigo]YP_009603274.1 hypothetical protein FDH66_gp12 [Arthrobacter phage Amigo]QFG08383.1 hypothetical protein SEA_YEEZUS_4 [Arthrobacter phage Yeezus]QFG13352.1 hypothetical protein SEA_ICHOR_4 [Arthrobacter phage Ichor]QFG13870.1 hypothetical protein SEA_JAEK_4 [Arthrobacter phage Jaek]QJD51656.1 hypothetical protein SEA_BOERSMA_4 [Arthrobacter phage Boersma]ALY08368.1 hypothetical protein AMIGO_4 [Arthrobacter phage Amigo]